MHHTEIYTFGYKEAEKAIEEFDKNAYLQSEFLSGFKKEMVVKELKEFVNNPDSFHPGIGTHLSGEAVLVSHYVLKFNPLSFVLAIIDIYNTGQADYFNGKNILRLIPSQNIRKWAIDIEQNKFSKATAQLFLFSIREHFNEIDYYRGAQNTVWASSFLNTIWAADDICLQQRLAFELLGIECNKFDLTHALELSDCNTSIKKIQQIIDDNKIFIACLKNNYLQNSDKYDITYFNTDTKKSAHFVKILSLISLPFKKVKMKWIDYGIVQEQIITVNHFNNIVLGGIYLPIP